MQIIVFQLIVKVYHLEYKTQSLRNLSLYSMLFPFSTNPRNILRITITIYKKKKMMMMKKKKKRQKNQFILIGFHNKK